MSVLIHTGDCRTVLSHMAAASVDCCVTSPPYFGLRDYGTASWDGGDADCDHLNGALASSKSTLAGYTSEDIKLRTNGMPFRDQCGKCGAIRVDQQMGLEPTPDEYIAGMVDVFRHVRRVLRDDGTLWLNIGDSYASTAPGTMNTAAKICGNGNDARANFRPDLRSIGIKAKDLIGIPWMLAFALRADGWYLRQDIIWSKPNPMPESVQDRCTKAHEYLFLLSKSQRYYFDAEAIAEPAVAAGELRKFNTIKKAARVVSGGLGSGNEHPDAGPVPIGESRNKRSVWTVATQPFSEAHFATFPPELIEPCIKAGCPIGGTVLDPFGGAGTTGLVADRLQRNAVLIELNPEYAAMARRRIDNDRGGLLDAMEAA